MVRQEPMVHVHHRRAPLTMRTNGGRHKAAAILIVISSLQLVALATLSLADAPNGQPLRSSDTHEVRAAAAAPIVASNDQLNDARSYNDHHHDDDDDNEQGVDMNLMNAAQDKLMVMKDLLATTDSSPLMAQQPRSTGPTQCTHKGRQYANGASVHIDEQPCLNCTCQMAILQCYLRVCPPIVSVEALRRKAQLASGLSGDTPHECRMVKEAHQCCPVMRCEPTGSAAAVAQQLTDELAPISNRSVNTSGPGDQMTAAASSVVPVTSASVGGDYLPKLTVINGPAGQRDSILLITSNPHASGLQTLSGGHFLRNRQTSNSSDQDPHGGGHPIVSSAPIIEALLETIYSSASNQLNGLNLQGSCMINGSLYFEGSAVLPETGHALGQQSCQYCYCIRQKVMCVKPRCHLIISGCKPKYSNEFACCPTSYSCDSPAAPPTSGGLSARLTAGTPTSGGGTRLAQALEEALARVSRNSMTTPPTSISLPALLAHDDAELTPRQVDGGGRDTSGAGAVSKAPVDSEDDTTKSTMLMFLSSLMTSPGESQANATTTTTTTTTSTTTTTTTPEPTTTSSSTTSTTTTTTTTSSTTTARPSSSSSAADEDESERDEPEADEEEANRKRVTTTSTTTGKPTTARTSTTEQSRSSVADFLEPMQKLGPHMGTPTTPAGCVENGRPYAIGEQIPSMENCRHCYCNTDGMKECKIVDCDLRGMQGCKPITREGHCCPVLFECPPSITMGGGGVAPPASLTSGADFRELHQCTSATGEIDSCAGNKTSGAVDPAPVLKSTRLVDPTTGSGPANSSGDSLVDELHQFMMHIRSSNGSSPAPLNMSSVEYAGVDNSTSGGSSNETSSSGDDNNKHTDYDSVRVPPTPPVSPIPPGMIGIPSIEPEVIGDLASDNRTETGSGQRDMRSTNGHALTASEKFEALNRMLDMSLVDISTPANEPENLVNVSQPTTNVDTDYVDLNNDTIDQRAPPMIVYHTINEPVMPTSMSNGSKLARTSRDNSQSNNLWLGAINNQTSVIFDDDLGAAIRRPAAAVIDPMPALFNHEQPFDNLEPSSTPSPPQPTTGTPIGLDAERALRPETTSWLRHLPAWTLNFGQRLSGTQDGFQGAASDGLQQGRGGAGLAPNATPTARSATSQPVARPNPFISMLKSIIATAATGDHAQQQNGGGGGPQARAANLVMRPLGIVAEHPTDATPPIASRSPAPYEPALSPSELEIVTAAVPHEPEVFGLPADSTGSAASGGGVGGNKELVVRASSSFARRSDVASSSDEQPEEGDHDDTPIVSGKRAPEEADTSVQFFSSVATAAAQQPPAGQFQVQVHKPNRSSEVSTGSALQTASTAKLSCFDVATNKSYQLNERIPKLDDPCKACSCVLGRELCQPLVCPERPAENCREERRPGECCPNYLCELSTSAAPPPTPAPERHDTPTGFTTAPSNRLMVASPSPSPPPVVINQQQAQPQARMVQPRFSLPSSGYQIRTGDLASILPPHLRFRPNLLQPNNQANSNNQQLNSQQAQMFNYDQTRLFFPNNQQLPNNIRPQQQQQQQQHRMLHNPQAPQATGEHQYRATQGINSAFIPGANSLIRPPLLMHPNQRQFIGSPARRNDDAPVQSINSIASTGSQVVSFQKPSPPALPQVISNLQQNTQHSTMRFPVPSDARQMPAGAIAQHQNHHQVTGWRTTSGVPALAVEQSIANNQQQHQPKLAIIPSQLTPAGALPVAPPVDHKFTPLEHHQPSAASSPLVPLVAPATGSSFDSSGFRPIVAPAQIAATSTPSEPSSVDRIQDTPTSTIKYSQPIESVATESGEPEVSESPATTSTTSTTTTTTPTPTTSTTEATPPPSTSTTTGSEAPASGDQLSDPFAFKVSECDIYGRVYKVGQPIEELSDSCKRCTCTSSGVDCKSRC